MRLFGLMFGLMLAAVMPAAATEKLDELDRWGNISLNISVERGNAYSLIVWATPPQQQSGGKSKSGTVDPAWSGGHILLGCSPSSKSIFAEFQIPGGLPDDLGTDPLQVIVWSDATPAKTVTLYNLVSATSLLLDADASAIALKDLYPVFSSAREYISFSVAGSGLTLKASNLIDGLKAFQDYCPWTGEGDHY